MSEGVAMRIGRRELVAAGVLVVGLSAVVGTAAAFGGGAPQGEPTPAGQEIVLDTVVRSSDSAVVDPSGTLSASSTTSAAPGTVPVVTDPQQPATEDPGPGLVDPTEPIPTTQPVDEPSPQPEPTVRCRMDDSDPVNYPNGREICETITP